MNLGFLTSLLLCVSTSAVFCQVAPSAFRKGAPITVGAGFSDYNVYWGNARQEGGTVWVDWNPVILKELSLDIEVRDLGINRVSSHLNGRSSSFIQLSAEAGPSYSIRLDRKVSVIGKFLVGYGKTEFDLGYPGYHRDSSATFEPGVGLDFRANRKLSVRAEYDYQFWPNLYALYSTRYVSDGFTVGGTYRFRRDTPF